MVVKKKTSFRFVYVIYILLLIFPIFELALRIAQYKPYQSASFSIISEPGNSLVAHPDYGICLNPGKFKITINEGHSYAVTHSIDSTRMTFGQAQHINRADVALFGCSYTYGMGVNDEETMQAIMTEHLPNSKIINYAVPGHGNIQGYFQLKKLIANNQKPVIAVFNFADFHLERNVLSPEYRCHLNVGFLQSSAMEKKEMDSGFFPYVYLEDDQLLFSACAWGNMYNHWKGRARFSTVNFIQSVRDQIVESRIDINKTNLSLFQSIQELCKDNDIRFLVAGLTQTEKTKNFLELLYENEIDAFDISLPLKDKIYNNMPYDSHPNALAQRKFGEQLLVKIDP